MPPISLSHRRASLIARSPPPPPPPLAVMTGNRALAPHLTDACLHNSSLVKCGAAPSERLLTARPLRRSSPITAIFRGGASRRRSGARTKEPSRCLGVALGDSRAGRHIGGSEEAWDARGHVPAPPSPPQSGPFCSHSATDAPPLAAPTAAKLCSGDKCSNHSPPPTPPPPPCDRDAPPRLLAPRR